MSRTQITFAVEPKANILDGITLFEPVDRATLVKLINSTLLKTEFNNKIAGGVYENEKKQLEAYLRKMEGGRIPITYRRSKNNPYGRCNPEHAIGLYQIRRQIRHTLASGIFDDFDIKNAHPDILRQLCEAEGQQCPELQDYVANRQYYFDKVVSAYGCNEEAAKNIFIMYSYGGGFKGWVENKEIDYTKCSDEVKSDDGFTILEIDELKNFRKGMRCIHSRVKNANPHLVEIVKAIKTEKGYKEGEYNLAGSVCSFVLQEYEVRILEQIFLYCSNENLIEGGVCVLCADGLMLEKRFANSGLLSKFTTLIRETVGFNLTFTCKPMTEGFESILKDHLNFDLHTPTFTDGFVAEHFSVVFANKFIYRDGVVYHYNGVLWVPLEKKNSALHNFVDFEYHKYFINYCYLKNKEFTEELNAVDATNEDKRKEIENKINKVAELQKNCGRLRVVKHRKDVVTDIINKIANNSVVFDRDSFLFAFNNKIFSLKENAFVAPHYQQYIATTCGYDYISYYSAARKTELEALINTIFSNPTTRNYYLSCLATGLYGQQIENVFIATGTGGNGKSLLNSLMMDTVGGYGYKMGASVLLGEIKEGANPAIANLNRKRFVLAQEPDNKRRICSATLKEITGDKTINARMNYSNDCVTTLTLTLVMECNELPPLDEVGCGVERRIRAIPFNARFVPKDIYDALEDKTNIGVANPYYKTDEFKMQHRQALFEILREHWVEFQNRNYNLPELPTECKEKTRDYLATSDDIYEWFSEKYEATEGSMVFVDDLYEEFKMSNVWDLMSKVDKRKNNKKEFSSKVEKNIFLRQYYKPRDSYFNGDRQKKPFIVGFQLKPCESIEYEEEGDSDTVVLP